MHYPSVLSVGCVASEQHRGMGSVAWAVTMAEGAKGGKEGQTTAIVWVLGEMVLFAALIQATNCLWLALVEWTEK